MAGRHVVLGVTGSIAAVETVKLARELVRHGARVTAVMTPAAQRILHPDALWFATGSRPVTDLTGAVEHVALLGQVPDRADVLLIAPATANTIAKVALGIDDTPVTTMATTALGTGVPVVVAPAMHGTIYRNPAVRRNLDTLRAMGVAVVDPMEAEGKAKLADRRTLVMACVRAMEGTMQGVRALVVAGGTEVEIDAVRSVGNRSTGATGVALAEALYMAGADPELWLGRATVEPPAAFPTTRFRTFGDLRTLVEGAGPYDVVLFPAAVSDFAPEAAPGKLPSGAELVLCLRPTPKILPMLRDRCRVLVGFKAESGVDDAGLLDRARQQMINAGADLVVANRIEEVGPDATRALIVEHDAYETFKGPKAELARRVVERVRALLKAA